MRNYLYISLLSLLPFSVLASIEVEDPTATASPDEWTNQGGANKVASITDAVDANYIWSKSTGDTNAFAMSDMTSLDPNNPDVIDSIRIYTTAKGLDASDIGTAEMRTGIRIGSDVTWGASQPLSNTTWSEFIRGFTAPPGSRGTWDEVEVDSLEVLFNPTSLVTDSAAVTLCSAVVFYSLGNRNVLHMTNTDGCRAGSNFGKQFNRFRPIITDTIKVHTLGGANQNDYFTTFECTNAAAHWETGGFTVRLNVIKQVNPCSVQVRINRVTSGNCATVSESTPFTTKQTITGTGEKTISIPAHDWSAGSDDDRVQLQFNWTNGFAQPQDTLWFEVGINENLLEHEIIFACPADDQLSCANMDTLIAEDTTAGEQQWGVSSGTNANKVPFVTDAVDADFIYSATSGQQQRFKLTDNEIHNAASIDTFEFVTRAREFDNGGQSNNRIRYVPRMTGNSNYCQGALISLTTTWTSGYGTKFTGTPSAPGSCAGTLDTFRLDSLEFIVAVASLGTNDSIAVTRVDVYVCYTATGGAVIKKRRRRIMESNKFEINPIIGFRDSQSWLWTMDKDWGIPNPDHVLRWE